MAFAHSHHARLEGGVEAGGAVAPDDELGGAAADVDHDGGLRGVLAVGHRAEERELGLLVPGEGAGVEAVVAAHALRERGPVGRVARGGGEHGEVGLAAVAVDQGAVVGEHRAGPLDSLGGEPPVASTPAPRRVTRERRTSSATDPVGCDVGDEQAGGVGADVDHGDAHGGDGIEASAHPVREGAGGGGPWPQSGRPEGARSRRELAARGGASGVRGTAGSPVRVGGGVASLGRRASMGSGALATDDHGASARDRAAGVAARKWAPRDRERPAGRGSRVARLTGQRRRSFAKLASPPRGGAVW